MRMGIMKASTLAGEIQDTDQHRKQSREQGGDDEENNGNNEGANNKISSSSKSESFQRSTGSGMTTSTNAQVDDNDEDDEAIKNTGNDTVAGWFSSRLTIGAIANEKLQEELDFIPPGDLRLSGRLSLFNFLSEGQETIFPVIIAHNRQNDQQQGQGSIELHESKNPMSNNVEAANF